MKVVASLVFICAVLISVSGWAGTTYINFDGDDGNGSSLPPGVFFPDPSAEPAVAAWAGYYVKPVFDGSTMTLAAGASLEFPPEWTSDGDPDTTMGPLVVEYTITNLAVLYTAEPWSGPLVGWNIYHESDAFYGLASMGSLMDPRFGDDLTTSDLYCGTWGSMNTKTNIEALYPAATKITIRVIYSGQGTFGVYAAFDDNATTPTTRPRLIDMMFMGSVVIDGEDTLMKTLGNPVSFGLGNWASTIVIDNVIIEGANVPDFGTAPTEGATTVAQTGILSTPVAPWIVEGGKVKLLAPPTTAEPANYLWSKDGVGLSENERITGVTSRELVIDPLVLDDAGLYTVSYDDAAKEMVETEPFELVVSSADAVPVTGLIGLGLLAAGMLGAGMTVLRRKMD